MNRCPHCQALAVRPSNRSWRVANGLAWIYVSGAVAGASLVGPFILVLAPILLCSGACLLAETHRRATAPAECDACGKYVTHRVAPMIMRAPVPSTLSLAREGH